MTAPASAFQGADIPSYDFLVNCMHCGLCLPHCPTYALTNREVSSPRGRIRLMKSVAEGTLPISQGFVDEMNFCLDCQACETACPAGVNYGALVESARAQIFQHKHEGILSNFIKKITLNWMFRKPNRLKALAILLKLYADFGFRWFFEQTRLLKIISGRLHNIQGLIPIISERSTAELYPEIVAPVGEKRFSVGLLSGCIMDLAYSDVNADTIELLRHHGCEVIIPRTQVCCGSLQGHNGDKETARHLARKNINTFAQYKLDVIIMNSAGCGAFMKEYTHLLANEPEYFDKARELSSKVKDITEFILKIGFIPRGRAFQGQRITYHDACHLVHSQKISREPRELIKAANGIEYIELPESSWCCGSAGIYNFTHYDDSMKLLRRKLQHIKSKQPDVIVTGNPGCMAQLAYGLKEDGLPIELLHTATFLRRACEA